VAVPFAAKPQAHRDVAEGDPLMSQADVRALLGSTVTVETGHGAVHGTLLSCTSSSLWLVDDGEDDVMVPLDDVQAVRQDAA
jgi:hypothetical protein